MSFYSHGSDKRLNLIKKVTDYFRCALDTDTFKNFIVKCIFYKKTFGKSIREEDLETMDKDLLDHWKKPEVEELVKRSDLSSIPVSKTNLKYRTAKAIELINKIEGDLSDIFELTLKIFSRNGGRQNGEYYTPKSIADLIYNLSTKKENIKVYDPCVGGGNLLFPFVSNCELYGDDISPSALMNAKIRFMLEDKILNGETKDVLEHDVEKNKFDLVVANPPFSMKWNPELAKEFEWYNTKPPVSHLYADMAFIYQSLDMTKEDGEIFFILFPGFSYRRVDEKARRWLIENNLVEYVIQLPERLFYNTNTFPILVKLNKGKKNQEVIFINSEVDFIKCPAVCELDREKVINRVNGINKEHRCIKSNKELLESPHCILDPLEWCDEGKYGRKLERPSSWARQKNELYEQN